MSLNEKFGHVGANLRKVNIHDAPDTTLLQNLIADLSISTTAAQCDVAWGSGNDMYTLSLNHSRQSARGSWKLYHARLCLLTFSGLMILMIYLRYIN